MKKLFLIFLVLIIIFGCQHSGSYHRVSHLQRHEIENIIIRNRTTLNDLVSQWGQPTFCNESSSGMRCGFYGTSREYRRTVHINVVADKTGLITDYTYGIHSK
jgi:hypothetical protein